MKQLKSEFYKNGYKYKLVKRKEDVAMFNLYLHDDDKYPEWEVCRILKRKGKYGEREAIPSNEQFGSTVPGGCWPNNKRHLAEDLYNSL